MLQSSGFNIIVEPPGFICRWPGTFVLIVYLLTHSDLYIYLRSVFSDKINILGNKVSMKLKPSGC